jgi:ribosomal protein L40E
MFCPECGTENPEHNKYCWNCGTKIQRPPAPEPSAKPLLKGGYLVGLLWLFGLFLVLGVAGCLVISLNHSAQNPFSPSLHVDDNTGVNWFGIVKFQFRVYNSGYTPAKNVAATIKVIGSKGELLASKTVDVGNLDPGESTTITTNVDGSYPEGSKYSILLGQK